MDYTGTGNSLNPVHPSVLRLIMDSLRYFVDAVPRRRVPLRPRRGARARVPRGRPPVGVLRHHPPGPDPVPGEADRRAVGRRRGRLPGRQLPGALDGVERHLPRRRARLLARRRPGSATSPSGFAGSADLYERDGRRPFASINFVTAHDGFTLADLVSYNEKHNEANLEDNRDGTDDNRSWNCGVEGPTDDPEVNELRARQQRNFLATLLLSQGVPMLARRRRDRPHPAAATTTPTARTTRSPGIDWDLDAEHDRAARVHAAADPAAAASTRCSGARASSTGDAGDAGLPDVWWFRPDGGEMTRRDWERQRPRCLGVFLNGDGLRTHGRRTASRSLDDSFLVLFNAHHEPATFTLPPRRFGVPLDARADHGRARGVGHRPRRPFRRTVDSRSLLVLRRAR